ncbi:MAG: DUF4344 domain-containing metallopeptidase [Gemmatimonadota bacterium]|nr:DUF4344 domain-containing metallopeptidase [Gemmatimonadota bacterium]
MRPITGWSRHLVIAAGIAVFPGAGAVGQATHGSIGGRWHWVARDDRDSVAFRGEEALPVIAAAARERGAVDSAIAMARRHLRLPNLVFVARSCGTPNAYYFTRSGHVVVCYEMLLDAYRLLNRHENASPADTQAGSRRLADAIGFAQFLFAHELGHAVIHRYRVPVVGEEEAAADQFALWLLSEDRAGPGLAVAHYVFVLMSLHEEWTDERVVDPHGLDLRRAQRIACWLSSIDELRLATRLTDAERRHCGVAVAQARHAWGRLLAPYRVRRRSASKPYFVTEGSLGVFDSAVAARARRRPR